MWLLVIATFLISCTGEQPRRVPELRAPVAVAHAEPPVAHAEPPVAHDEPAAVAADPREATRRAAHDVLAEHCGECHEGHRPTAPAKALAVFDLDKPDWPARFDAHRYEAALMRLAKKSQAARDAFIAFRDAELAASPAKLD